MLGCNSQRVVLLDFATTIKQKFVGGQYLWRARDFTYNCKSSLTQDCIDKRGQNSCLEECLLARLTPPQRSNPVLNDVQVQPEKDQLNEFGMFPLPPATSPFNSSDSAVLPAVQDSSHPTHSTAVVASIASALGGF